MRLAYCPHVLGVHQRALEMDRTCGRCALGMGLQNMLWHASKPLSRHVSKHALDMREACGIRAGDPVSYGLYSIALHSYGAWQTMQQTLQLWPIQLWLAVYNAVDPCILRRAIVASASVIMTYQSSQHISHCNILVITTYQSLQHISHHNILVITTYQSSQHISHRNISVITDISHQNILVITTYQSLQHISHCSILAIAACQ